MSESSQKKERINLRRNERSKKFWDRIIDFEKSLEDRNLDIINVYLSDIKKAESWNKFYIENKVRDCINDIMLAEWENDNYPWDDHLSTWQKNAHKQFSKLSDHLIQLFKQKQEAVRQQYEIEKKKEKKLTEVMEKIEFLRKFKNDSNLFKKKHLDELNSLCTLIQECIDSLDPTLVINWDDNKDMSKFITIKLVTDILLKWSRNFSEEDFFQKFIFSNKFVDQFIEERANILSVIIDIDDTILTQKNSFEYWKLKEEVEYFFASLSKTILEQVSTLKELIITWDNRRNFLIEDFRKKIEWGEKSAIELYIKNMLPCLGIDPFFEEVKVEFRSDENILILDYKFVDLDHFPNLKEIKIYKDWTEKDIPLTQRVFEENYDKYVTGISLRLMYEIFKKLEKISLISFNGWICTTNKWTGHQENLFIMSIQVKREECLNLNLSSIDPKTAFRSLKWISARKLSDLTPINPIIKINTNDHRFIEWYNVADWIDSKTNLAAMDWQDFENLIREVFWKEFSINGWEVKITQASRDWWVDAIAFDPDPIKGWKIVIQAKRYTNTVDVSAVRDLHGTVQHEWANKWILVTTATFWSDSYEYVKNKPITLIDWGGLLFLLEKHGYSAKIDLREAKKILNLKQK